MTVLPDGRVTVPVSVNGQTMQFLVDTAGVFSEIGEDTAQKLNLKETDPPVTMYGVGGKLRVKSALIESFKIGNNEARDFHIGVRHGTSQSDAKPNKGGEAFDGLLAPDFLSLFDVEFDFAAKKMYLFSQDHCPGKVVHWTQDGYAELPFQYTGGPISTTPHIRLRMTLDGHDVSTAVDTGAAGSFIGKGAASLIFGIDEASPGVTKAPYFSDQFPVYRKQFTSLALGGLAVQNPQVDILPDLEEKAFRMEHSEKSRDDPVYGTKLESEDFTLGMNVLSKLHVYIAYKEHKMYVTAAGAH